ncbi:MAG: putative endonuclease/exonuclease/phosphatase family protein [Bacteroidetes bacterium]|nr:putative endonuclease/exonuclease/phosphatase family protein [Bacteroidota bacterium]
MKKLTILLLSLLSVSSFAQQISNNPSTINVMTFNVRLDTEADGLNNWKYRKEIAANTITFYQADIVGTQEVLHNQLLDLEKLLPDYSSIGVGREDGMEKGEYSAIFYNNKKLTETGSGYFWLSENPLSIGQKGWDAACERIATWAKLKDNKTGKIFFVLNTHFDHIGKIARRESAKLILNKVKLYSKKMPVIVMGDFNSEPESEAIQILTDTSNPLCLTDSYRVSPIVQGPEWTFHEFGRLPLNERTRIDYIFVKNNVKVLSYKVIDEKVDNKYVSDHNPVLVQVGF